MKKLPRGRAIGRIGGAAPIVGRPSVRSVCFALRHGTAAAAGVGHRQNSSKQTRSIPAALAKKRGVPRTLRELGNKTRQDRPAKVVASLIFLGHHVAEEVEAMASSAIRGSADSRAGLCHSWAVLRWLMESRSRGGREVLYVRPCCVLTTMPVKSISWTKLIHRQQHFDVPPPQSILWNVQHRPFTVVSLALLLSSPCVSLRTFSTLIHHSFETSALDLSIQ